MKLLSNFRQNNPKQAEVFVEYFGENEVQQICDIHVGSGAQVQNIRFFNRLKSGMDLVPVYDAESKITRIQRADVTMWHPDRPNSRTLIQLHRTESIDSYTFENQSQAYQIYCRETQHLEKDMYTDLLYKRTASSLYYLHDGPAIVEWSITEDYDFSLYECIRDNAENKEILQDTMQKVWTLFKNMYACGLVHGSMTPINVVFNVFMRVTAKMLGSNQAVTDRATISAAKLTFLNNCLGAHQTVFVMHLYDVLVFLKSACRYLADMTGTCKSISTTICKGLSYLGKNKNFLVQPDLSMLPNYGDQVGSRSKTELKGILVDQSGNTLTEFPSEGCIDEKTVRIDWKALNEMGNFIHSYIYRSDDISTVAQVSNTFTQLIQEDKHSALMDIMKHLAITHPQEYMNKKIDINLNDGTECVVSFTKKEKKKTTNGQSGKKKTSGKTQAEVNRPMGYLNIQPGQPPGSG